MNDSEWWECWSRLLAEMPPSASGFLQVCLGKYCAAGRRLSAEDLLMMVQIAFLAGKAVEGARELRKIGDEVDRIRAEIEAKETGGTS